MLPKLTPQPDRRRKPERRKTPFRYSAAVNGSGEIQWIQEFIGRRLVRHVDPAKSQGRQLLVGGQVALWCQSVVEGERLPVGVLLDKLHAQAIREMEAGAGLSWNRCCRERLESIENWQAFYRTDEQRSQERRGPAS